jgi:hypothetical protein
VLTFLVLKAQERIALRLLEQPIVLEQPNPMNLPKQQWGHDVCDPTRPEPTVEPNTA